MNSTEHDDDGCELVENEIPMSATGHDVLLEHYSVRSPGVEIVLDGRAITAPPFEKIA